MESCQYQPHLAAVSAAGKDGMGYCSSSNGCHSDMSRGECRVLEVEMELGGSHGCREGVREGGRERCSEGSASLVSEAADPGGNTAQLPFSKELITFSLFGKIPTKHKHEWKASLNSRIEEVQQAFKNIPEMLYFSPSSVSIDGVGVYAAESLPKDTLLGPYVGKAVRKEQVDTEQDNQWLWEVYEDASTLSYFIDARDPKHGNWMNFIQCARHSIEQNLRMAQYHGNLYFVVTADIRVGDELLVWYDEEQYDTYMGIPTGFREIPPPPLFLEQQSTPHGATAGQRSPTIPPPPLQEALAPPTYPSYCPGSSAGGSSFSDSASTDDSGVGMETSGGPTPPLATTYDMSGSRHASPHKEGGGALPTEGACNGVYMSTSTVGLGGMMGGVATLPSSSDSGFTYSSIEPTSAEQLHQWYTPISVAAAGTEKLPPGNMQAPGNMQQEETPANTPGENPTSWGGVTRPSSISMTTLSMALPPGSAAGTPNKKQLLYGLFSRSEDGSRWHCEECKRLFSSQGSLRAHARIHTGERPYQCQYCFRAFCQASTLRSHERLHTGEKPYKCEDCGRAFTQSAGLRSHRKTHRYDN